MTALGSGVDEVWRAIQRGLRTETIGLFPSPRYGQVLVGEIQAISRRSARPCAARAAIGSAGLPPAKRFASAKIDIPACAERAGIVWAARSAARSTANDSSPR